MSEDQSAQLLREIRLLVPGNWTPATLSEVARDLEQNWQDAQFRDQKLLDETLTLAVKELPQLGASPAELRQFCAVAMLLSFLHRNSPDREGMFKAVVASVHIAIDVLADYDLAVAFCASVASLAQGAQAWKVVALAQGDGGIALARSGRHQEAIPALGDAIRTSVEHGDLAAAARYGAEQGRSQSELGLFQVALATLQGASRYAELAGDQQLRGQIDLNLGVLARRREMN